MHIICDHLEDFIERQKKPLGEFSEEVVEAAHQRLDQIWQWYIVKMVEKEKHGTNFLACVNHFNLRSDGTSIYISSPETVVCLFRPMKIMDSAFVYITTRQL